MTARKNKDEEPGDLVLQVRHRLTDKTEKMLKGVFTVEFVGDGEITKYTDILLMVLIAMAKDLQVEEEDLIVGVLKGLLHNPQYIKKTLKH